MSRAGAGRVYRVRSSPARPAAPTVERRRHARYEGGLAWLETGEDGVYCQGVRYPLLIDYLRDTGRLSADNHGIAMRVRELYERTGFRAHMTASYQERVGRTTDDPEQDDADDRYRRLDRRVLRNAGKDAWTALRSIVIEDRMTAFLPALPRALAEAERWL